MGRTIGKISIRDANTCRGSIERSRLLGPDPFVVKAQISALCHVWTAPPWQGFSLTVKRGWLVQPCVRPVDAARRRRRAPDDRSDARERSAHTAMAVASSTRDHALGLRSVVKTFS